LLLIASDVPTDAELTEIKSFWMWDPVKEKWDYIRDREEHKREVMRKFEQRWRTAWVKAKQKPRPLTRRTQ
jgi:hypothetical protein